MAPNIADDFNGLRSGFVPPAPFYVKLTGLEALVV
jgi:hypothetical protein